MDDQVSAAAKVGCKPRGAAGAAGCVYGLGVIGSVIYFLQHAPGFWLGVLGVLKALVWPAILAYKLLEFLKV
ncbi:MAG: hypothetical protein KGJ93_04225 [Patescibacteria group bacterium]|nr:hypothetical protein [Patescibacteria group bacterium]